MKKRKYITLAISLSHSNNYIKGALPPILCVQSLLNKLYFHINTDISEENQHFYELKEKIHRLRKSGKELWMHQAISLIEEEMNTLVFAKLKRYL